MYFRVPEQKKTILRLISFFPSALGKFFYEQCKTVMRETRQNILPNFRNLLFLFQSLPFWAVEARDPAFPQLKLYFENHFKKLLKSLESYLKIDISEPSVNVLSLQLKQFKVHWGHSKNTRHSKEGEGVKNVSHILCLLFETRFFKAFGS